MHLSGLHGALKHDEVLQALAQTPLMLNVMTMAYRDVSAEALASPALSTEAARRGARARRTVVLPYNGFQ